MRCASWTCCVPMWWCAILWVCLGWAEGHKQMSATIAVVATASVGPRVWRYSPWDKHKCRKVSTRKKQIGNGIKHHAWSTVQCTHEPSPGACAARANEVFSTGGLCMARAVTQTYSIQHYHIKSDTPAEGLKLRQELKQQVAGVMREEWKRRRKRMMDNGGQNDSNTWLI